MERSLEQLQSNATMCLDLASTAITPAARDVLVSLAREYEHQAADLQRFHAIHPNPRPAFKWGLAGHLSR